MRTIALFFALVSLPWRTEAQLENAQWRFPYHAGISFTSNPPAFVSSAASGGGGACSSIADANGNLLFYVSGMDVYNRQNQYMNSGAVSLTGGGTTQGVLIVKKPGANTLYYIFVAGYTGLRYSVVDMSLAAGLGSVTVANQLLTTQSQTYKIAGTRHCNGTDVWIVTQDEGQYTWHSYLLTSAGISTVVASTTAHQHVIYAAMKFSPDGSKIATSEWGDGIYLYDFNKSTGAVSGMTVVAGSGFAAWGVEFSPDGSKLYGTRSVNFVFQWDLDAGNASAIAASQYTVWQAPSNTTYYWSPQGALQLAVDGKIYQSYGNSSSSSLSVIHNPDAAGSACNYTFGAIGTQAFGLNYGLPNQVKPLPPRHSFNYTLSQVTCNSVHFAPITGTLGGITSLPPSAISWNFGDPSSGSMNASSQVNSSHVFTGPGSYTVTMVVTYAACMQPDTIIKTVTVPNNGPSIAVSGNTLLCYGESTTLTANGAANYTWSSSQLNSTGASIVVTPTAPMVLLLSAQNAGGCVSQRNVTVSVVPQSVFQVSGPSEMCVGQTATLTATGVQNYTWTTAAGPAGTGPEFTVSPSSSITFTVFGSGPNSSCIGHQAFPIIVLPYPPLSVSPSTQICAGDFITLGASGATTYSWNYSGGLAVGPSFMWQLTSTEAFTVHASDPGNHCISESLVVVQVTACTGLKSNGKPAPRLYPTSFDDVLFLECQAPFSLSIIDLSGRVVFSGTGGAGFTRFEPDRLSSGTYIAIISSAQQYQARRIVKTD